MKKIFKRLVVFVLVLATLLSLSGCELFDLPGLGDFNNEKKPPVVDFAKDVYFVEQGEQDRQHGLMDAVNKVERSVVAIERKTDTAIHCGSGVIVDVYSKNSETQQVVENENEFYIITCHHVLGEGGNISVYLPDRNGRNYTDKDYDNAFKFTGKIESGVFGGEISLVGGDKVSDIAILKLNISERSNVTKDDIVEAKIPHADYEISKAEEVFAIGNPTGSLPGTVSRGIVAYLDRETLFESAGYMYIMQINVDIYHGSSGGGLFNYYGELVGITNGGNDSNSGINYSIPYKRSFLETGESDTGFIEISKQLIASYTGENYGYVVGRWNFGVTISENTGSLGGSAQLKVESVVPGSNAALAGVEVGDIIKGISYNDGASLKTSSITGTSSFQRAVHELNRHLTLGDSFTMEVTRGLQMKTITMNIQKQFIYFDTGNY